MNLNDLSLNSLLTNTCTSKTLSDEEIREIYKENEQIHKQRREDLKLITKTDKVIQKNVHTDLARLGYERGKQWAYNPATGRVSRGRRTVRMTRRQTLRWSLACAARRHPPVRRGVGAECGGVAFGGRGAADAGQSAGGAGQCGDGQRAG